MGGPALGDNRARNWANPVASGRPTTDAAEKRTSAFGKRSRAASRGSAGVGARLVAVEEHAPSREWDNVARRSKASVPSTRAPDSCCPMIPLVRSILGRRPRSPPGSRGCALSLPSAERRQRFPTTSPQHARARRRAEPTSVPSHLTSGPRRDHCNNPRRRAPLTPFGRDRSYVRGG